MTRGEAVRILKCMLTSYSHIRKNDMEWEAISMAVDALQEPEHKHGYWIEGKTHYEAIECHCSECDQLMTTYLHKRMKFCPNCGAIMDGGEK